jgi:succinoglycan biosynthesis protein ExoM
MSPPDSASSTVFKDVDVCVCTFRRASVADLLASLAKQELGAGWRMRIIVADNDITPSAKEVVEKAFADNGLNGVYVHAPAQNISIARNACLDAAAAPLIAFIDDDETARPGWLAHLIQRIEETNAGVAFGRVQAIYPETAPRWLVKGDFHSTEAFFRNGVIEGGYTCNVVLRQGSIGPLRFNPAFGRTGGEDTSFFGQLARDGVQMTYAADAVVDEPVPPARSRLKWLTARAFRSGQSHAYVLLNKGEAKPFIAIKSVLKIGFCAAAAVATIWWQVGWRKAVVRGALHAGVLATVLGKSPLRLY